MYNFHGIYRYSPKFGSNWRAVVAFFFGCIPPLPGFVDNIQKSGGSTTSVSIGGQHLFAIGYIYSFITAGVFYYLFNVFAPHLESQMDYPVTGEEILMEQDEKNLSQRRASYAENGRPNALRRAFHV